MATDYNRSTSRTWTTPNRILNRDLGNALRPLLKGLDTRKVQVRVYVSGNRPSYTIKCSCEGRTSNIHFRSEVDSGRFLGLTRDALEYVRGAYKLSRTPLLLHQNP